MGHEKLEDCIRHNLQTYIDDLQGLEPSNMYDMLLRVVERPLLQLVMEHTHSNQSRAAQWLGLNRNTLRKKLVDHDLLGKTERD